MIVDLREIKRAGKSSQSFFFEFNEKFDIPLPNAQLVVPIKVVCEAFITESGGAEVEGEIAFAVKGECTRCLKETEKQFVVNFDEVCGEEGGIEIINDRIDLTETVKEIVIVNIPITFLCKDDCKGLCPDCGSDLNESECKCNNEQDGK